MYPICSAESLSFSFGGMADQSASCTRVTAKYNGLAIALPGTSADSSLSPPFSNPARVRISRSPLSFSGSSP